MTLKVGDVELVLRDYGGQGFAVLFLHGLAGYAGEWDSVARGLADRRRVVALDARGHGASTRRPARVDTQAHVDDVRHVIEHLGLGPVVIVGQSLGGQTALLFAKQNPELASGLVMVESGPASSESGDGHRQIESSLRSWPVPFPSRLDAIAFFTERGLSAAVWANGLEQRSDGLWPRFDIDTLVGVFRSFDSRSYWSDWAQIACPVLVVRGDAGEVPEDYAIRMVERARDAELIVIADASHDVHIDQPEAVQQALERFLDSLK